MRSMLALPILLLCLAGPAAARGEPAAAATKEDGEALAAACGGDMSEADMRKLPPAVMREKMACFTREAAKRFNETLPTQVDPVTTLQSVSASGVTLTYHFTVAIARQDVPAGALDKLKAMVADKVCKAADMSQIIKMGGAYAYEWKDKNGELIGAHVVDRCD
jgi:hypothetical protein